MAIFRVHLAAEPPLPPCLVPAATPADARTEATRRHPGARVTKIKLDRSGGSR
ncbi:hypothetical protein NPA31_007345 [Aurantimonas sp. MSK8Z-1]|uniref:hypothetical protein n=1 Tax=Mangrovibrevibacter kandeliae TaxID=2968473 RepID=UPI0021199670|nr:hypothetical protein [Aurantimonas sp. MSK8Z-1]MCW4114777.1 hypothetical protein [Aurantimonas sp. MSK8Z-1]